MDGSQALGDTSSNAEAARDLYTAVYFMPQAFAGLVVQLARLCRGRPRVNTMHKRLAAGILAVCVGVAFAGPALAQGGTTGANAGIPLWLPPAPHASLAAPVHHPRRGHGHSHGNGHGTHQNYTTERY
jgi:hypothetical protein